MKVSGWTTPRYPGDAVRIALLIRSDQYGDELGEVRIQDYGPTVKTNRYHIGAYLPGVCECHPGDTPKTEPDRSAWFSTPEAADVAFVQFVDVARTEGWADYNRETGKAA